MPSRTLKTHARRETLSLVALIAVVALMAVAPEAALAQSADMPGQQLLQFAKSYIIAPIALFAIVVSGVAAFIRPDLIRTSGYIAIIAVVLYFILGNASQILQVLRAG